MLLLLLSDHFGTSHLGMLIFTFRCVAVVWAEQGIFPAHLLTIWKFPWKDQIVKSAFVADQTSISQQMWLPGESKFKACARKRVWKVSENKTRIPVFALDTIHLLYLPNLGVGNLRWGLSRWAGVGISCCVQGELQRKVVHFSQIISESFSRVVIKLGPSKTRFLAPHSLPVVSGAVRFTCSNLLSFSLIVMKISLGLCSATGSGSSCIKGGSDVSWPCFSVQHCHNGINISSPIACWGILRNCTITTQGSGTCTGLQKLRIFLFLHEKKKFKGKKLGSSQVVKNVGFWFFFSLLDCWKLSKLLVWDAWSLALTFHGSSPYWKRPI